MKNLFKIYYICFISFLLFSDVALSQIGYSNKIDSLTNLVTTSLISRFDRELSGDTSTMIGGLPYTITSRHYNSPSNSKAAQYIFEAFQSYGLNTRYQTNSTSCINVLGVKTGTKYPNQYFVICCHYDDMPSYPTNNLAPGADDNASGTVGVLTAAKILSSFPLDYTIVFAAFDEEERGLYGSKAYSDSAFARGDSIVGVINLDMIAYDGNNDYKSYVVYNNPSSAFADEFISAAKVYVPLLNPVKYYDLTANSDHASFWTHNYKAFCSIEDENDFTPFYHTVNDKFNTLNIPFFQYMVKTSLANLSSQALDYKMNFSHVPINSGPGTGQKTATVVISSKQKIAKPVNGPRLYYKVNSGSFTSVNYFYNNIDTFKFNIPGQSLGSSVSYYFAAQDSLGNFVCTYPAGGRGISPPGTIAPSNFFTYQIEALTTVCIGTGINGAAYPYNTYWMDSKTDMLYTSSEIISQGGSTGNINTIGFNVSSSAPQIMNGFNIKMQNSNLTFLTGFVQTDWITVYSGTYSVPGTGIQYIDLQTPFYWDGVSNLLIEICFDNNSWTAATNVLSTNAPGMTWTQYIDNSTGCTLTAGSLQSYRPNLCVKLNTTVTGIQNNQNIPKVYSLSQNYPNPFNPITKINYSLPKNSFVSIKLYDILGRLMYSLVNEEKNAGYYSVDFNASELASGVYYYRMESGGFVDIKKLTVIK